MPCAKSAALQNYATPAAMPDTLNGRLAPGVQGMASKRPSWTAL
jgi:hypothetical protein